MNFFKKILSLLSAVAVCSAGYPAFCISAEESVQGDDWLHVEGNKVYNAEGNEVWITGCNWFGFNVGSGVFDGVWSQNMHDMINQIADHGFNFLRVPVSTQILLQWMNDEPDPAPPKVNPYVNPELVIDDDPSVMSTLDSKSLFNKAVEWCDEAGIKIMIDIHSAETHAAGHNFALWYNDTYSTEDLYTALEWFADEYKNDDTIVAIDIKNEPHGTADTPDNMAKWDDSDDPNNWKMVAETAGKRILDINPNLLIVVEGVEVYPKEGYDWTAPRIDWTTMTEYYYGTWWGANLRGVKDYPVDLGKYKNNLIYSPHDYGPLVYDQKWFYDGFTQESVYNDCWHDNWAYIYEDGIAPLLIGEWGGFMDGDRNEQWMTYIRDYIIENHLHHTFWCFNENSGDTGGLVYDNFSKWDEEKYNFVKPSLWQTDDGKFIGLDHEIPLGKNGITVAEYYGGGGNTGSSVLGDVSCDGAVDVRDITLLVKYILGSGSLSSSALKNADVNSDGKVNVIDVSYLKRQLISIK